MIMTEFYPEPEEKKGKEIMGSTFSWHISCPYLSYCVQFWKFEKTERNTGRFYIEAYYMIGNKWIWIWE